MNMKERLNTSFMKIREFVMRTEIPLPAALFMLAFIFGAAAVYAISPPGGFPKGSIVEIRKGMTLHDAAVMLDERSVVRSPYIFETISRISLTRGKIIEGEYFFPEKISVWAVAVRLGKGDFGIPRAKVFFPEGLTVYQAAEILREGLQNFDADRFVLIAAEYEGYLFPDTYHFSERATPEAVLIMMLENFDKQFAPLEGELALSGHSKNEIVAMASIIEKEAWDSDVRRMISGILWKRIEEGIPLQVDAAFNYVNGKNTYQLSYGDLRIDSPYNTYRYRGLPPTAIANPGLDSIEAALRPTPSPYFYYLSDREGNTYYAEDFDGHKANKRKHLN